MEYEYFKKLLLSYELDFGLPPCDVKDLLEAFKAKDTENAWLRGIVAALVETEPVHDDGEYTPYCIYCGATLTGRRKQKIEHKDDCPWLLASKAMEDD